MLSSSKSEDAPRTPRQNKRRGTRSVASSTGSNASGRRISLMNCKGNTTSFAISPVPSRHSILSDITDIQEPRRRSWWRRLDENSREVLEVLKSNKNMEPNNVLGELDIEVLSQEQKLLPELLESSDSESIASIVIPQRQLFTQKENQPPKNVNELIRSRESMNKNSKSQLYDEEVVNVNTKEIFQSKPRSKPVFPSALLNLTNNQTLDVIKEPEIAKRKTRNIFGKNEEVKKNNMFAQFVGTNIKNTSIDSTKEIASKDNPVKNIFGTNAGIKRKNMFSEFVGSGRSNMSIQENVIRPRTDEEPSNNRVKNIFGNKTEKSRKNMFTKFIVQDEVMDNSQIIVTSPPSSYTTDIEIDEWVQLPSSTMMEHQLQDSVKTPLKVLTPIRKTRSQNVSPLNEINSSNETVVNTTKQNIKSYTETNKSKYLPTQKNKANSLIQDENISMVTRGKSKISFNQDSNTTLKVPENNGSIHITPTRNNILSVRKSNLSLINNSVGHKNAAKQQNVTDISINKSQNAFHEISSQSLSRSKRKSNTISLDKPNTYNCEQTIKNPCQDVEMNSLQEIVEEKIEIEAENIYSKDDNIDRNSSKEREQSENIRKDQEVKQSDEDENHSADDVMNVNQGNDTASKENNVESQLIDTNTENDKNEVDEGDNTEKVDSQEDTDNNDVNQDESMEEDKNQEYLMENEDSEEESSEKGDNLAETMEDNDQADSTEEDDSQVDSMKEDDSQVDSMEEEQDNNHLNEDDGQNSVYHEKDGRKMKIGDPENDQEVENSKQFDITNEEIELSVENENEVSENDDESDSDNNENENSDDGIVVDNNDDENESYDVSANVVHNDNKKAMDIPESDEENQNNNSENLAATQSSPEAVLRVNTQNTQDITHTACHKPSLLATKSGIIDLKLNPSLLPTRELTGMSDGTRYSSIEEGSGWDSHRTTRKTLRQTYGRDFTPRKSLRTLVMEKSTNRQTALNNLQVAQANSPELPQFSINIDHDEQNISNHDQSIQLRHAVVKMQFQRHTEELRERLSKMGEEIKKSMHSIKAAPYDPFKIPTKPYVTREKKIAKKKPMKQRNFIVPLESLPGQFLKDLKYKPPKRFQPRNAGWTTKRLYTFLESKLEPRYGYRSRVRAERLVQDIYEFVKTFRKVTVANPDAIEALKLNMARLNIVRTHEDFYDFFHDYMPNEVGFKVIPDFVNKLPVPRDKFGRILDEQT